MIHRLAATLIVIFWVLMTGLLVLREMYPEVTRLNEVPVKYVGDMVFQHAKTSDLQIYDGPKEVGFMHFQPQENRQTGSKLLDFHGTVALDLPGGAGRQRVSWIGNMEMDQAFHVLKVKANLSFQQGGGQIDLLIEPPHNIAHYTVRAGNLPAEAEELTLDEAGFAGLLAKAGLPPMTLPQLKAAGAHVPTPELTAQSSRLVINGETLSTFLLNLRLDEQPIIEAHLSEDGQILRAQIPLLGYKFAPPNIAP